MACILDGHGQATLLQCRHTRDAAGQDLALIVREAAEELAVEIVDHSRLLERIHALLGLVALLTKRRIDRIRIVWCCHVHVSWRLLRFCILDGLRLLEALVEALDTTGRIDEHLLARIERMRLRVDFQYHAFTLEAGARLERRPVRHDHIDGLVCGMDTLLHAITS